MSTAEARNSQSALIRMLFETRLPAGQPDIAYDVAPDGRILGAPRLSSRRYAAPIALVIELAGRPEEVVSAPWLCARLEVTDALGSRTVPIESDRFEIGRRSSHDLHLTGSDVSRDHAEIERRGDRFMLRDRGSQSGTFVNGEPIAERVLEEGDRIHVGRNSGADLVFHIERSRAPASLTAGADLQQIAGLLDGLRALGSGRVLDEVLALVLDSAISVTGASAAS